jgi:hypothetical protein
MFFPGSRYFNQTTYALQRADGPTVQVTRLPLPGPALLLGYYQRGAAQRLDLIANHFLADATTFWRLCDANDSVVPDALAHRNLVGVPRDAPVSS